MSGTDDYARSAVPEQATVSGLRLGVILIGVQITLPAFLAGTELGRTLGLSLRFLDFLVLLGVVIPPLAGVYIGNFFLYQSKYIVLNNTRPVFHAFPFICWITGAIVGVFAFKGHITLTSIPSLDAIGVSFISYSILGKIFVLQKA